MKHVFTTFPKELLTRSFCAGNRIFGIAVQLVFLFFLIPVTAEGQQPSLILFNSVILDADTREPLTGAHFRIQGRSAGAADSRGMVSFYAHPYDTVVFTCVGYREARMVITDTLFAREYTAGIFMSADTLIIPAVVVVPRLGNIRAEILADKPLPDQEMVNASNNLRISAYQGLTGANELGDPATNYELLRRQQRIMAYEKGGIPSDQMAVFNPLIIVPVLYVLAKGLPEDPPPPAPYMSPRELQQLRAMHDSLVYGKR